MPRHIHIHVHRTRDGDWEEAKHPRAANGEFGSGGTSSGRPSGKSYTAATARAVERKLRVMPGSSVDTERIFGNVDVEMADVQEALLEEGKAGARRIEKPEMVRLRDLIPTQPEVTKHGILSYVRNKGQGGPPITAMAAGGKLYLVDGHHRAATLILAGAPEARIMVIRRA